MRKGAKAKEERESPRKIQRKENIYQLSPPNFSIPDAPRCLFQKKGRTSGRPDRRPVTKGYENVRRGHVLLKAAEGKGGTE